MDMGFDPDAAEGPAGKALTARRQLSSCRRWFVRRSTPHISRPCVQRYCADLGDDVAVVLLAHLHRDRAVVVFFGSSASILLILNAQRSRPGLDTKLLLRLGSGCEPVMNTLSLRGVWFPPRPFDGGTPTIAWSLGQCGVTRGEAGMVGVCRIGRGEGCC